ncbi:hypothetical protein DYB37_005676 [Aphanomyces astaci]|uniref:EF-hand domain-containing protein n=1 Tax=Aphanomyces astaci TaxID=112090 RepID=A0A3R7FA75_APHAT|nr:hypothetical protein DYB35_005048 [Aphanomyces astaci]RHZ28664.1 hypothetical protein DYB37_005676 [Aphanomyces astaci]
MVSMQAKTRLTPDELQLLGVHFQRYQLQDGPADAISSDTVTLPTGSIDRVKFQQAMGLPEKESIYADRLFHVIDANHDSRISFDEFAQSRFDIDLTTTCYCVVSFDILDMDGDGKLSKPELTTMLHTTTSENNIKLTKEQIELIVDKTFVEIGADKEGVITFDAYSALVTKNEGMISHLSVNLAYLLSSTGVQATLQATQ